MSWGSPADAFWGKGFLGGHRQQAQTAKRPEKNSSEFMVTVVHSQFSIWNTQQWQNYEEGGGIKSSKVFFGFLFSPLMKAWTTSFFCKKKRTFRYHLCVWTMIYNNWIQNQSHPQFTFCKMWCFSNIPAFNVENLPKPIRTQASRVVIHPGFHVFPGRKNGFHQDKWELFSTR